MSPTTASGRQERARPSAATALVTANDLAAMPDGGDGFELIRGRLVAMSPTGPDHGRTGTRLTIRLGAFVERHELGETWINDVGFRVDLGDGKDTVMAPDIAFLAKSRPPHDRAEPWYAGAPDLAIEIVSPSQSHPSVMAKAQDWITAGAQEVWLVDPENRTVEVLRAGSNQIALLGSEMVLESPLVPGFSVKVGEIFARPA
jgi:Uma2 family endonuclease